MDFCHCDRNVDIKLSVDDAFLEVFIRYVSGIVFIRYVSGIVFIRYVFGIVFIRYVSGIVFIKYAQNRQIRKPNNLKVSGCKKTKEPIHNSKNRFLCFMDYLFCC